MQTHAAQALASWREEKRSAWLYRVVSDAESGSPRQILFLELAQAADGQASLWEAELHKLGVPPPATFSPDLRARLVAGLIPRLGVRPLKGILAAMKVRGMSLYAGPTPHATPTNLEQMRGKSLAWADANSASGYLIPRFSLRRAGIGVEPGQYFSRTGFGGGHEQAVVAVLQRQYDAAVTWTSGQGDEAQGFSRGNLTAMVQKGLLNMRDLRIIWRSEPILNGPMGTRTDLPAAFREDIKRFHLALPKAHPDIYKQIERGGGTGYREVRHQDFELFVELRREEAAARRRRS